MIFTNWINLIFNVASLFLFSGLFIGMHLASSQFSAWFSKLPRLLETLLILVLAAGYYFLFHHPVVDVLSTQLYVREHFGVSADWEQARELRSLFSADFSHAKWQPMEQVRLLPLDQRLPVLLLEARIVSSQPGQ